LWKGKLRRDEFCGLESLNTAGESYVIGRGFGKAKHTKEKGKKACVLGKEGGGVAWEREYALQGEASIERNNNQRESKESMEGVTCQGRTQTRRNKKRRVLVVGGLHKTGRRTKFHSAV